MKEKPYIIRGDNFEELPCVIKVSYGNKYVIAKCLRQSGTVKNIEDTLNAYLRGGNNNPNGLWYFLLRYVEKNPGETFKVETLLASESAYELLKLEHLELEKGRKNKAMLNNQTEVYIPAYNEEKRAYGWIPPISVLNFNNWLKKHKKQVAAKKRSKTIKAKRKSKLSI